MANVDSITMIACAGLMGLLPKPNFGTSGLEERFRRCPTRVNRGTFPV